MTLPVTLAWRTTCRWRALAFDTARPTALPLRDLGLASVDGAALDGTEAARAIDREFYLRSQAHYEASFKILGVTNDANVTPGGPARSRSTVKREHALGAKAHSESRRCA